MDYTDLQKVKDSYMSPWNEDWDPWVTRQIPVASAMLRQEFKNCGMDLDKEIEEGDLELILVEDVQNSMIHRRLAASDNGMGGIDFASMSSSAGPYSMSITPVGSNSSFYISKQEKRRLGLPSIAFSGASFH